MKAGAKAEATERLTCSDCGDTQEVTKGQKIPQCPSCGGAEFRRAQGDSEEAEERSST